MSIFCFIFPPDSNRRYQLRFSDLCNKTFTVFQYSTDVELLISHHGQLADVLTPNLDPLSWQNSCEIFKVQKLSKCHACCSHWKQWLLVALHIANSILWRMTAVEWIFDERLETKRKVRIVLHRPTKERRQRKECNSLSVSVIPVRAVFPFETTNKVLKAQYILGLPQ